MDLAEQEYGIPFKKAWFNTLIWYWENRSQHGWTMNAVCRGYRNDQAKLPPAAGQVFNPAGRTGPDGESHASGETRPSGHGCRIDVQAIVTSDHGQRSVLRLSINHMGLFWSRNATIEEPPIVRVYSDSEPVGRYRVDRSQPGICSDITYYQIGERFTISPSFLDLYSRYLRGLA